MKTLSVNIPGFTIAYKAWGNPKNPPIIAIHGWLDNANSFDRLASILQNQFYLVAIDLPGHGHSSHLPHGCYYHLHDGIFTLIEIIDALHFDKVHLLGHSMGACLCSLMAGVVPDRLLSLSLIEGLGPLTAPDNTASQQLSEFARHLTKDKLPHKGYVEMSHAVLARSIKGYVSSDIAKILVERSLVKVNDVYFWRHDQRLKTPSPLRMTEGQVLSCLRKIQSKTLLIFANQGYLVNAQVLQKRMKAVKSLRVEYIEGGHHIHMEQPGVVGPLLVEFYRSID